MLAKKAIILLVLALIPVYFALLGFADITDLTKRTNALVYTLLINPEVMLILGVIVGLVIRHKRAMWWGMVVCFVYAYLAFGLVLGGFYTEGPFGRQTVNSAALMAVIGFVASLFTYLMVRMIRKLQESAK